VILLKSEESRRKLDFENVRDIVLLSFAVLGLSFIFPAYISTVPRILLINGFPNTLIALLISSELLFLFFLNPVFEHVLDITRSAIGRRTPYIISFGVLTSFVLSLLENINHEHPNSTFILTLLVISANFCLYLYSLALFGLIRDKSNESNQTGWVMLRFQAKLWSFVGTVLSFIYCSRSSENSLLPAAGLVLLISSLLAAFFIVEDKKYKVKMSPFEKNEHHFSYEVFKILKKWDLSNTMQTVEISLVISLFYYLETFTAPFTESSGLKYGAGTTFLTLQLTGVTIGYVIKLFTKKNLFSENLRAHDHYLLLLNATIYLLIYITFKSLATSYLLFFVNGLLWGLFLSGRTGMMIPSKAERFIFYFSKEKKETVLISLFVIIFTTVLGAVLDWLGLNAFLPLVIIVTILEFMAAMLHNRIKTNEDLAKERGE